ncbi:MAG TPA: hypothetical protein DD435_05745 [Cyanobacteria bacterium UBA8530]|nr:hypothetical protein [Cyanobacteria bacterium UBA8530]
MSSNSNQSNPQRLSAWGEDEIDFLEVAGTLWKGRLLIAAFTAAGATLSGLVSLTMPNVYTATATIMPMDSSTDRLSSAMSALGALGGLASQAGVNLKGSVSDKFVALLKSRTVTDNVVTRHRLMPVLFADRWDKSRSAWKTPSRTWFSSPEAAGPTAHDAYRFMKKTIKASADPKTGLISINVDFENPQVAADIANDYVIELNAFLQNNSFSSAKRNRDFLQNQVNGVLHELGGLANSLKLFQEKNKLVSLDAQTEAAVQAYAALKAQLTAKEMELTLQANSVSTEDVQLSGLKQEIVQLKDKIGAIESGSSGGLVSFKDAPKLGMQFAELKRDLLVKQNVFELLTQQLELAKLDEAKETLSFQVVDRAIAPDHKSKPNRFMSLLFAAFASFMASGALLLVLDARRKHLAKEAAGEVKDE